MPRATSRQTSRIAAAANDRTAAWSFFAAATLAAFYLATNLYIASHRLLWIDEVLTALTTRLPDCTAIWHAFAHGADGLPPTYFMLMHLCDGIFRHTDIGLRVPSALAMTAGLLLTFDCARRLSDGLHGLIALSVLTCSFLPYYGHEARSYALYFMLAALALWIWVRDVKGSWLSAVAFGAVIFLAVTMHYYAVLSLVPFAVWELVNWKPWQFPSRKIVVGALGLLAAVAVLWIPIQAGRRLYPADYLTRPSLDVLRTTFADLFPDALLLLAVVVVWIAWVAPKTGITPLQAMPSGERIGWFFLLIPIAGYLLAQVAHAFQLRYVIATLPGVAIGFACWLWRHFRAARYVSMGVLVILAGGGLARQVKAARSPDFGYYSPIRQMMSMETPLLTDGKRFFAVSNPSRYMEALHYSNHPEQYVFYYVNRAGQHEMRTLGEYYPMQFWTLDELKRHAGETALLAPLDSELRSLRQAGFEVDVQPSKPLAVAYLK